MARGSRAGGGNDVTRVGDAYRMSGHIYNQCGILQRRVPMYRQDNKVLLIKYLTNTVAPITKIIFFNKMFKQNRTIAVSFSLFFSRKSHLSGVACRNMFIIGAAYSDVRMHEFINIINK